LSRHSPKPRPGAADVDGERAADDRGVAERRAGVAAVVESAGDQEVVDLSLARGVARAESPVVAILLALVPVAGEKEAIRVVEDVIEAAVTKPL